MKREFASAEEAFSALSEEMQAHSRRVEAYTDLLFMEACSEEVYIEDIKSKVRLKPELRELTAMAARYHDIGKVLVPAFYEWEQKTFSPEEHSLYRKHCLDGQRLIEPLLAAESSTPTLIHTTCEAVGSHHERWDGQGYPSRTVGEETPIIGRIVGLANALDHLLMETRTETPIAAALSALTEEAGAAYDPVLVNLLTEAKRKLAKVFSQYAGQSRAIPQAERVIRRRANRPMCLEYRPIADVKNRETVALEAEMTFRRGKDWVSYGEIASAVRDNKLEQALGISFLLETCDTLRRLDACGIRADYIALHLVPGWLRKRGLAKILAQTLEDADTAPCRLCLIVTAEDWHDKSKSLVENLGKLREMGWRVLLDGVSIQDAEPAALDAYSITDYRIPSADAEQLESGASAQRLHAISQSGVGLLADGIEKRRYTDLFGKLSIACATGAVVGEYSREDALISGELALL